MMMTLPYPPSVNHYWRHYRGHVVISREGRTFRENVRALLAAPGRAGNGPRKPPSGGRIALCMDAFPPDRRRRDLDNIQKPVLDALEHAEMYEDDSQIDLLLTRRGPIDRPHGRLAVHVDELPLRHCPLCHRPLPEEPNAQ
ncbi:MAG: RusA family crossover junction endodeoxyribonuclease [Phycisphaeraceae bacterium]